MSDRRIVTQSQYIPWWKVVLWALLFQIAWNWQGLAPVINNGELIGPDDFLRLHQITNWMNGQGWYDLTAHRMYPPIGGDIHWSRLVDVPIAGLIWFFDLFTSNKIAARLAAIVWPTLLIVATVAVLVGICDRLVRDYNRLLAVLFSVLCVSSIAQFVPGRLDHHNVQILLFTLVMLGLVMRPDKLGDILIGTCIAVSISIGLDSAMLFVPILAFLGFEWAMGKNENGQGLARVGAALAITSLGLYALNMPVERWSDARCDANSLFFLSALLLVSGAYFALGFSTRWLAGNATRTVFMRFALGGIVATISVATLLWLFPHCSGGPFSQMGEEVSRRWLDNVQEAQGLIQVLDSRPSAWLSKVGYLVVMLAIGAIVIARRVAGSPKLVVIYFIVIICSAGMFFQIRILQTGIYAAIPFCVIFAMMSWGWLEQRFQGRKIVAMAVQTIVCIVLLSASWTFAGKLLLSKKSAGDKEEPAVALTVENTSFQRRTTTQCYAEQDYTGLSALNPGLVMGDLDNSMSILVHTSHQVISGPYHRNERAILDVMDFFWTDIETAHAVTKKHDLDYIALCVPDPDFLAGDANSDGLAARIVRNEIPTWLEWISPPDARIRILRVVPN